MTHSQNANPGCFSGVLRRLLCTGSLPTHPSDHITESNTKEFHRPNEDSKTEAKFQVPASPGIVARLMGLDSLPDTNWVPNGKTPDSVTRSRSVNFMDYLLDFDLTQAQHRRVRSTSLSFREVPTLQQNHGLLVLYLDNVDESKKMRSKLRKSEMGLEEMKQKKEERGKNKEKIRERGPGKKKENQEKNKKISKLKDEPRRISGKHISKVGGAKDLGSVLPRKKSSYRNGGATSKVISSLKPMNQKEASVELKLFKRKSQHAVKKVDSHRKPENSSPVSVLDLNDCPIHHGTPLPERPRPMELNSNVKISPTPRCDDPLPRLTLISKSSKALDNWETDQYYIELAGKLNKLTEEEIKEINWIANNAFEFEDFEEICVEFGQQILDVLLQQLLDELGISHGNS